MTKEFDKRNAAKSRKVCEAMAGRREHGKLSSSARGISSIQQLEDGEALMVGEQVHRPSSEAARSLGRRR